MATGGVNIVGAAVTLVERAGGRDPRRRCQGRAGGYGGGAAQALPRPAGLRLGAAALEVGEAHDGARSLHSGGELGQLLVVQVSVVAGGAVRWNGGAAVEWFEFVRVLVTPQNHVNGFSERRAGVSVVLDRSCACSAVSVTGELPFGFR